MKTVNMLDAKTHLSRLVEAVERGEEREVVIARHGKPAARLVPLDQATGRVGVARGRFVVPDDIDADNAAILDLMRGGA